MSMVAGIVLVFGGMHLIRKEDNVSRYQFHKSENIMICFDCICSVIIFIKHYL